MLLIAQITFDFLLFWVSKGQISSLGEHITLAFALI
jgi:hypothetical protein